jgi:hypothetical protein
MKVRLTRIIGGSKLRTDSVDGEATYPPMVGRCFEMSGQGLDFGTRLVSTSPVVEVSGDGKFTTESGSVYHIELLERPGDVKLTN